MEKHIHIAGRVLSRLNLRQIRLLVAVGENQSILRAASALNVSQPAATRMIKELELDFDVQLFQRTNRGTVPTLYGEVLIRHSKLVLAQVSSAAQELGDLKEGVSGRISVGTLLAASSFLLPRAIEKIIGTHPEITVEVVVGGNEVLIHALRAGETDMVVGRLPSARLHQIKLSQEVLFQEDIVLVTRTKHPLTWRKSLKFSDFTHFGWIFPPAGTVLRGQLDRAFAKEGYVLPTPLVESVSYLTNLRLLQNTDLIGLMPRHVAESPINAGMLSELSWDSPFGTGLVGVSYRESPDLSAAAKLLLGALRDVAMEINRCTIALDSDAGLALNANSP